jgi:hypothetical protein
MVRRIRSSSRVGAWKDFSKDEEAIGDVAAQLMGSISLLWAK